MSLQEATVYATGLHCGARYHHRSIGRPRLNYVCACLGMGISLNSCLVGLDLPGIPAQGLNTAEKFIPNYFIPVTKYKQEFYSRMYVTGDLCKYLPPWKHRICWKNSSSS